MNLLETSRVVPLRVAKWDNYFPVYDQIFQTLSEDSTVVELGVLGGAACCSGDPSLGIVPTSLELI